MATDWNLGYTYGLTLTRVKGATPDTSSFVHLWRKDDAGLWRMVLDLENPFPKRR